MWRWICLGGLLLSILFMNGCAVTPAQKLNLEKNLNQEVNSFINDTIHSNWDADYALTTGRLGSADNLKANLQSSLPANSTLTGADIVSMAWVDSKTAKVKINWAYLDGTTAGFSCETFVWIVDGDSWKYEGRAIQ